MDLEYFRMWGQREIKKIANHVHLPKSLMHTKIIRDQMIMNEKKKEANRLKHLSKKEKKVVKK